jgi:hypothetical protein
MKVKFMMDGRLYVSDFLNGLERFNEMLVDGIYKEREIVSNDTDRNEDGRLAE